MTEIAALLTRPIRRLGSVSTIALVIASLFALGACALLARAYTLRGSVLPGVRVAGVDVGGLSSADAQARIQSSLDNRLRRPVEISVDGKSFTLEPKLVFSVDAAATERLAFDSARGSFAGRLGALAVPFAVHHDVEPVLRAHTPARAALLRQLAALTKRPVDARITLNGTRPVVVPAQPGTALKDARMLALIRRAALTGGGTVTAPMRPLAPPVSTAAAERTAASARTALAAPVALRFKRKEIGQLGPKRLAQLLRFKRRAGGYDLVLDPAGLERIVGPLVHRFTRRPVDASFRVMGTRVSLVRAREGTSLDVRAAQDSILEAAVGPRLREARIGLAPLDPDLTTQGAKALGIRQQISTYTTDMGLSSANRISNVHLMARYIDGTIIKPGEVFSFNEVVGPRTPERGFLEGQMILGSLLVPAIGGGVCQTATTLFNNAFELGLPIIERHNHSWYISHYPLGRDATVSWGGPDLKFRNDLGHAILIKTSYTDSTLTFSFYGSPQGRTVTATTGPETNFRSPQPSYAYDPSAPEGSVRTVGGSHAQGFDVTVFRKVFEHGKLIRKDSFTSHYVAVGDTTIYGPGTNPPRIDFTLPSV